jgi:type IV pilus assembly protein PilV
MAAMNHRRNSSAQLGTSLIEVLITLVVTAFGLLGLAGLQYRVQVSDMESYQRAQALVLLDDMSSRLSTNRAAAATYITASPLGAGMTCPAANSTQQQKDAVQWCQALQGAAEVDASGKSGAMIGARGCVASLPNNEYMITVAWQGLVPVSAPAASVSCGVNQYDGAGDSQCKQDRCRRVVTTIVRIADLS